MGILNPTGNSTAPHPVWPKAGSIGLVGQSGILGTQLLAFAEREGIGIRAFSGSGNEAMITIEDYLNGFEVDDLTKTVVLYIESIKDGRASSPPPGGGEEKPVIILKGGRTAAGNRAPPATPAPWRPTSRSSMPLPPDRRGGRGSAMDLLDLSAAFSSLPLRRANGWPCSPWAAAGGWWPPTSASNRGWRRPILPRTSSRKSTRSCSLLSRSIPVDR
jgi:hypothetical protein